MAFIRCDEEEHEEKEQKKGQAPVGEKIEAAILGQRRIFLCAGVDDKSAQEIIKKLWFLEYDKPGEPILFVINSPGGSVDSGFAIWDQIQMISSPVTTLVTGIAASMGSVLSLSAKPGRRFATEHSRIMIHQPRIHGVMEGQATDLDIQAQEILNSHEKILDFYCKSTGKSRDVVRKALDRDTWFSAKEALEFGLLDKIVKSYKEI